MPSWLLAELTMRLSWRLPLVVASAVLYGWAFPPHAHRWLAWLALVPFFLALRETTCRRRILLAWVWSVAMAYTVNDWFPREVSRYFAQPSMVGIMLFLGVATCTAGLQYMAFAASYPTLARRGRVGGPLLLAAAWVAADLLRLRMFGGDPWAIIGYSQVGFLSLMQVADATGVHGITFVVVLVNATLAEGWCTGRTGARTRWIPQVAIASGVVVAVLGYGAYRLRSASGGAPPVPVAVVQVDLPLGSQWRRDFYGRNLDIYLTQTAHALRESAARLVVWPENAMTFFVAEEPAYRAAIASTLRASGTELLAGGPEEDGTPPSYRNSAFLIAPTGDIRGRYDKRMLLPFAEYFPFAGIDLLRRNFGRVRAFTSGSGPEILDAAVGPVGTIVCNEGFFAEPAAARAQAGATLLVNLANDSWLADPKYSEPAFDMVTLRAVEQRRWVIRASTGGPSGLVDPFGRVVARTGLFETTTLIGTVAPRGDLTVYGRVGDVFAWCCLAVTLVAWNTGWRRVGTRVLAEA